ncbi:hypothetical protein [Microbulbifer sp.]|uniref:hypothetical protein n=1 Tax=Microbulbifer sp. TaxID=1908541 RepID=UPI00258879B3|nr:hypothetical protein [Microbulbifer sp.]
MIAIHPLLNADSLESELPLIDRYNVIIDGAEDTAFELDHISPDIAVAINFCMYESIHDSLVTDFGNVLADLLSDNPRPLITIRNNGEGCKDHEPASSDFEYCHDPERLDAYSRIVQWLIEYYGAKTNLKVQLNPAPNPFAQFSSGKVSFLSPFPDGHTYRIENPRYIDIFRIAAGMINQACDTEDVFLKEIYPIDSKDNIPKYSLVFSDAPGIEKAA